MVSSERKHIGFFGMRNSGKSSLVNAFSGQSLSIVSDTLGTTTDPVKKTMELLPLGPVVIIDTPGIDDTGELGKLRVNKAISLLDTIDIAILVVDITKGIQSYDTQLLDNFKNKNIAYIIAYNKCDLLTSSALNSFISNNPYASNSIYVSSKENTNIYELKEAASQIINSDTSTHHIVSDIINPGDLVVLVVPIDSSAPKGRLILPQQLTIREILEAGAISLVTRETELKKTFSSLKQEPALVITDSQVFNYVSTIVPEHIPLTSFAILMMRYKGSLDIAVEGAKALDDLENDDTILICEGCTHHRQCKDIGSVKLPKWLTDYTGKKLNFVFTSGHDFPENIDELKQYSLVIHCGGCMLTENEIHSRIQKCQGSVPFTNYGVVIAKMNSILDRCINIKHLFSK